ncbi:OFA family MFS transporter [bacterium]|nr:OFA family MFS transporter [bacterium]
MKKRWLVVLGALLVQLCLGAIYAWGAFTKVLQDPNGPFGFSATQTSMIFSAGLATFAIVMIMAGRWQDKIGPRKVALLGAAILGLGYISAGLFGGTSFWAQFLLIGVMGGAGIGLGYVCPIAASVKWFPDLKGFVTGLAVAGFGAGAFIFIKLAGAWGNFLALYGVNGTFVIFGIIFLVVTSIGALMLSNPPAGWKPEGWAPTAATSNNQVAHKDFTQGETIKTIQFWMLWLSFVFSAGAGLMIIKCLKNFGELEGGLTSTAAASALGLLALFNGAGRIVWGSISNKLGARKSIGIMTLLQAVMLFAVLKIGTTTMGLTVAACWIGFNFGGNFALFPLATAESFGTKNLGANYGAVFTSYGVGGILMPLLAGQVWDTLGSYHWAFIAAASVCVLASILGFAIRPPKAETCCTCSCSANA